MKTIPFLEEYKAKTPEVVFQWSDSETDAKGYLVINSLRGGAAGGGTRMRKGLNLHEVVSLAKVMEIKFSVTGPAIGGAKSGIDFDPFHPDKEGVLKRWYRAVAPILKRYYGTGGDLNVDAIKEVVPITESYGLWHPQEGILNGHFGLAEQDRVQRILQLRKGVSKRIENASLTPSLSENYCIADLITGYGVAKGIEHYYDLWNDSSVEGKRVIVQGWGNVAAPAAFYLSQRGAIVTGIIDRAGGIIDEEGIPHERLIELINTRKGNALHAEGMLSFDDVNRSIWDVPCEIFLPSAASRLVSKDNVERLSKAGLQAISAGANVPFADEDIFYGPTANYADNLTAIIPDFIANCGMARTFGYLMQPNAVIHEDTIFEDVSNCVRQALQDVHNENQDKHGIARRSLGRAIAKLRA
ncbi:MAG TPA: amino acid dehydrogenase [Bacteroidetes bacterium]|nr:amino acid dehydrogenase [Bacteroidota bacterium]